MNVYRIVAKSCLTCLRTARTARRRFGDDVVSSITRGAAADASFRALSADERNHLLEWRVAARIISIDAVEDLTLRPWPCPITGTVLGIFQTGDDAASWLVVGQHGTWAVADCADGRVMSPYASLAEALADIYPGRLRRDRLA